MAKTQNLPRFEPGERCERYWPAKKIWRPATVVRYVLKDKGSEPYELLYVIQDGDKEEVASVANPENYREGGHQLSLFV